MVLAQTERTFLPGMGRDWLLPLYDPLTKLLGIERLRQSLLAQAALRAGDRILDIGCGTGSLAVQIKRRFPEVEVTGLDPDPKALARARRKAGRAGVAIQFDSGFSDTLPYADRSFDRVFSSFMLHHLERAEKEGTLREVRRVLKPGGRLEIVDFGDDVQRLVDMLTRAGLAGARCTGRDRVLRRLPLGYYQASAAA